MKLCNEDEQVCVSHKRVVLKVLCVIDVVLTN